MKYTLMRKYGLSSESKNRDIENALYEAEKGTISMIESQQRIIDLLEAGFSETIKGFNIMNINLKRIKGF